MQAYALKTTLEKQGHEVWIIDRRFREKKFLNFIKTSIKYFLGITNTLPNLSLKKNNSISCTKEFIDTYISKRTKIFLSFNDLKKNIHTYNFDFFIVGSDQIWNPKYYPYIEEAFFSFLPANTNKIAYATSFGTETWNYTTKQTINCKNLLANFKGISVREDKGIEFCRNYFNQEAIQVLDPTMLLSKNDYFSILDNANFENKKQVFAYILDNSIEKKNIAEKISEITQLGISYLNFSNEDSKIPLELRTISTVEEWLLKIINSEFVITDSYHGCIFSILFNKPFYVIGNNDRGISRFNSLLSQFQLNDRLIMSINDISCNIFNEINWGHINLLLEEKRELSLKFLFQNLK